AKVVLPSVFVQPADAAKLSMTALADELARGDLAAARQRFTQDQRTLDTLASLDDQDRQRLSVGLRNANCTLKAIDLQVCTVSWMQADGTSTAVEFSMAAVGGQWIIIAW